MKKREFNSRLHLRKRIISKLQQRTLQGGTDPIGIGYVIITGAKIETDLITKPRICGPNFTVETCPEPIETTQVTTIPPTCMETCPSV